MIFLQGEIPQEVTQSFIEEWGAYGGIMALLLIGIGFLVVYIKKENKIEKTRIIKNSEENQAKVGLLHSEIKDMQKLHSDNQTDMLLKSQEIQTKTVEALNKTTDALNNNSLIFGKLIEKL